MNGYYDRINIYNETMAISKLRFSAFTESIKSRDITLLNHQIYDNTLILVEKMDTIDATLLLLSKGLNPVLLNMANPVRPGGGVANGATAQEENIFRRSNYFLTLQMKFYPILDTDTIYSKDVIVFRDTNYDFIDPNLISIIASPSVRHPELNKDFSDFKNIEDYNLQYKKIEMIFKTAIIHGHDSIVLSAYGCGAFKCPPKKVAEIFNDIIKLYKKYFKCIMFAIIQPVDCNKNNYGVFKEIILQ